MLKNTKLAYITIYKVMLYTFTLFFIAAFFLANGNGTQVFFRLNRSSTLTGHPWDRPYPLIAIFGIQDI